jgi:hypothetical protein
MLEARRIATLSVAVSLALPAGAFAQGGAGETQYADPLEGQERAQADPGSGTPSGGGGGGGELSTTAPSGTTETQAAQTRTPSGELARTGAEPGLIALLGMGLVMTGAGLRVRVRRPFA